MWILPSRSRPHNCARLFRHVNTPGVLCVDDDDPLLPVYESMPLPTSWRVVVGPRAGLSEIYNRQLEAHPYLAWYGILADDVLPETPGWDRKLIDAALPDGMAFGDDGINGPHHATHFVLAGDLARSAGWLGLPGLSRIYIDTAWNDIALARGVRRYLPDVKLTHMHFSNGRALKDAVYRKPDKDRDWEIYRKWRSG